MKRLSKVAVIISTVCLTMLSANLVKADESATNTSYDHLVATASDKVDELYLKQGADFSHYDSLALTVADVGFRKNAYRSSFNTRGQMKRAMETVTPKIQLLFDETFREVIEEHGHYTMSDKRGDNTLLVVPKLINVYLANLGEMTHTSSARVYAESAGEMTLVLELYDSVSGEILARVVDNKEATDWGHMVRQTSIDNNQQIRRMVKGWATDLNNGLMESAKPD
ncbi:DUF3313 domain-containing protein [Neiella marina]|uniref:DUF3313 domain-containing protein n=1 Tax=Neiella holothuriorum TaxID=2870530 RepID=A0ABS7EDD9_9GAMM|nr:DUF3313 family protein [Neiella holothuriorum]MBW8190356.1 DUF3313 domain-containing protein [Neiella holothuriorum]